MSLKSFLEKQEVMVMRIDTDHVESVVRSIERVASIKVSQNKFVPPVFYINGKHSWFLLEIENLKNQTFQIGC